MRKIIATVAVSAGLLFAGIGGASVQAAGNGPSACMDQVPGEFISLVAQDIGIDADNNPGNSNNSSQPFVPFVIGCNAAD